MHYSELNKELGNIDLYLLDQILKGRFEGRQRILDAGCGEGRNLRYFLNNNYDIYGVDNNPMAIQMAQMTYKNVPKQNWKVGAIEGLEWEDKFFDAVICSAVLHFAQDENHFLRMIEQLARVLKVNGQLFIRTACSMGMQSIPNNLNGFNYLMETSTYDRLIEDYNFSPVEPFKTVLVENSRSMAVLSLIKK